MPIGLHLSQDIRNFFQHTNQISRDGLSGFPPLIISCALTGTKNIGGLSRTQATEAMGELGHQAYQAGASILRVSDELSVLEQAALYTLLRKRCPDAIISNHTGGRRRITRVAPEQYVTSRPKIEKLDASPEMAAIEITCNVSKGDDRVEFMAHQDLEDIVSLMRRRRIKPAFELFKTTDIKYLNYLEKKALLDVPYWCELHFGTAGIAPILDEVITAVQDLPKNGLVALVGEGAAQLPVAAHAIILGLHVCVGTGGVQGRRGLQSNVVQQVEQIACIAKDLGRPTATPAIARQMVGLSGPSFHLMPQGSAGQASNREG